MAPTALSLALVAAWAAATPLPELFDRIVSSQVRVSMLFDTSTHPHVFPRSRSCACPPQSVCTSLGSNKLVQLWKVGCQRSVAAHLRPSAGFQSCLQRLEGLLAHSLPNRIPIVTSSSEYDDSRPLAVRYDYSYEVAMLPSHFQAELERRVSSSAFPAGFTRDDGRALMDVHVSAVEPYLESIVGSEASTRPKPFPLTVVLFRLDSTRITPQGSDVMGPWSYVYVDDGGRRFPSWTASSGTLVWSAAHTHSLGNCGLAGV